MTAPGAIADHARRDEQGASRSRLLERIRLDVILVVAAIAAIVGVAIVLRFADLATNPGGLFPDEAAEAVDAQRLLHWQGIPPVWFTSDGGREALFAYLVAGAFQLLGQTVFALRATSAALGVAGVVAIGALGWRFGRGVGLVAAAWAAGGLWLVAIERDGMRNGIVPLAGALAMLSLLWWQASPSRRTAVVAGVVVALAALYTYQPLKLLPVLVILWLFWLKRSDPSLYRPLRRDLRAFVVAFTIMAVPMAIAAVLNPANYFGRVAAVTPFNPAVQADDSLPVHLARTLGMFTVVGDPNVRHTVDGIPLLGPPALAWPLFLIAALGIVRLWHGRRGPAYSLVLLALPVFMIPPLPAVEGGSPHFLRALGLAAPLAVTIGLGFVELAERARAAVRRVPRPAARARPLAGPGVAAVGVAAVAICLLGGQAVDTANVYLSRPVADRYYPYSYQVVALAETARSGDAVIVDNDSAMVVTFLTTGSRPDIVPDQADIPNPASYHRILALDRNALVALMARVGGHGAITSLSRGPDGSDQVWVLSLAAAP